MQVQIEATTRLSEVQEGMEVQDNSGNIVGRVAYVQFGFGGFDKSLPNADTMQQVVEYWLGRPTHISTVLCALIYHDGYVCIDRGLLRSDVIALPTQIAGLGTNTLYLKVHRSDLLQC